MLNWNLKNFFELFWKFRRKKSKLLNFKNSIVKKLIFSVILLRCLKLKWMIRSRKLKPILLLWILSLFEQDSNENVDLFITIISFESDIYCVSDWEHILCRCLNRFSAEGLFSTSLFISSLSDVVTGSSLLWVLLSLSRKRLK